VALPFRNERAADAAKKHELGYVMIVLEGSNLRSVGRNRDAFGNHSPPQRKLDRLTDWTKGHRKEIIVLRSISKHFCEASHNEA